MKTTRLPRLLSCMNDDSAVADQPLAQQLIGETLEDMKEYVERQTVREAARFMLSYSNFINRKNLKSCEQLNVIVLPGDICFIDFGQAYLNEAGYQHFGLVLSIVHSKAFVVPMTSNPTTYAQAYDPLEFSCGKRNLMRLGLQKGMNRNSVLFLNDCKFINTSRIIEVKGHIGIEGKLFKEVEDRVKECLFDNCAQTD